MAVLRDVSFVDSRGRVDAVLATAAAGQPASASPPQRAIALPPDADGAEGKLLRVLQIMMTAYQPGSTPTPRERAMLRRQAHEAIDAYLVSKLAESYERSR